MTWLGGDWLGIFVCGLGLVVSGGFGYVFVFFVLFLWVAFCRLRGVEEGERAWERGRWGLGDKRWWWYELNAPIGAGFVL